MEFDRKRDIRLGRKALRLKAQMVDQTITASLGRWTSRSKPGSSAAKNVEIDPIAVLASRVRGTTRVWPGAPLKSVDVQRGVRWTSERDQPTEES